MFCKPENIFNTRCRKKLSNVYAQYTVSLDKRSMLHIWETGEVHIVFWWVYLRKRDKLEDLDVDGR